MKTKELILKDEYGVFADSKDVARVDSRYVAEFFEKDHRHVMRDIRELDCSEEFRLSNFGLSSYINLQGKKQRHLRNCTFADLMKWKPTSKHWLLHEKNSRF